MNRKFWLGGMVIGAVLVGMAVWVWLTPGDKGVAITQRIEGPPGLTTATAFGENTLIYSDGQRIIRYNYTTGEKTPLSPDIGPDGLKYSDTFSVSADQRYILFRNIFATPGGLLASKLAEAKLGVNSQAWWVYDIQNQTFKPAPQEQITTAKLDGGRLYVLATKPSGQNNAMIISYDPATMQQVTTANVPAAADFFVTKDGFALQTSDGTVYSTQDGVVSRKVLESTALVGLTRDKNWAIAVDSRQTTPSLAVISLADWTVQTVASGIVNAPAWDPAGVALYVTGDPEKSQTYSLHTYSLSTKGRADWSITKEAGPGDDKAYVPQVLLGADQAVVSDTSGTYYLIGGGTLRP